MAKRNLQLEKDLEENIFMFTETGARTCTTTLVTGGDKKKCGQIYEQIHHKKSPPGQTGSDDSWFLKKPERVFASSLFLIIMEEVEKHIKPRNKAFIHAYWLFWKMMGSPSVEEQKSLPLNSDRANFLVSNNKNSEELNMKKHRLYSCSSCSVKFLKSNFEAKTKCPICE